MGLTKILKQKEYREKKEKVKKKNCYMESGDI